jgi:mono/diheme cytochrome c family protein
MAHAAAQKVAMTTESHDKKPKPAGRTFALLMFAIFAVVAAGGTILLLSMSRWNPPNSANQTKNPQPATPDSLADGMAIYSNRCLACHGPNADGKGERAKSLSMAPADLTPAGAIVHETDGMVFWKISEGHRPMPAYRNRLTEKERWDLVNYLRSLRPSDAK